MNHQKKIINNIRSDEFQLGQDGRPKSSVKGLLNRLHRMSEQLSEGLYEKTCHFIFELIQNAEDNTYVDNVTPSLRFYLLEDDVTNTEGAKGCLCILNNEEGFNEKNVKALCDFNNSTKINNKSEGYIGEKGIGFKSVFMVTDSPHIYSNGFHFKYKKEDPVATIGYVVPYWLDVIPDIIKENSEYTTAILLPLIENEYEEIQKQLYSFQPETILFLKKLKKIEIFLPDEEIIIERTDVNSIISLLHIKGNEIGDRRFWLENENYAVPDHAKNTKREGVRQRDITIAFPLDGISGHEKIFAYLPTEEFTGLPFYVNSDFLLPASRENIKKQVAWNEWLIDCIGNVVAKGILSMLNDRRVDVQAYQFIPLEDDILTGKEIFTPICNSVYEQLQNEQCIRCDDSKLHILGESRLVSRELRELLEDDRPTFFDQLYTLHPDAYVFHGRLEIIGLEAVQISELEEIFNDDNWLKTKGIDWLARSIAYISNVFNNNLSYHYLSSFKVFPLNNGKLSNSVGLFLPLKTEHKKQLFNIPNNLKKNISILDGQLIPKLKELEINVHLLCEKFRLNKFSLPGFIDKTLIRSLKEHGDEILVDDLKLAICFCLESWDELEKDEELDVLQSLPLLLFDNVVIHENLYHIENLVTPRNWDNKKGWQFVFDSEESQKRFNILHDYYTSLKKKHVKDYFNLISASEFPLPRELDFNESEINSLYYNNEISYSYKSYIETKFFNNSLEYHSTITKSLTTFVFPEFFNVIEANNSSSRDALVLWIRRLYSEYSDKLQYAKGIYRYRNYYHPKFDSALYRTLIENEWINTTQGLQKPGRVFFKDETIATIFSNTLPLLEDKFSESLIDFLGIHKNITQEELINYLLNLSTETSPAKDTLLTIYKYLYDFCEDYEQSFFDNKLIFVPQNDGKWLTSQDVIWESAELILGDNFGWLSKYYPHDLMNFFIHKIEVKQAIDPEAYADAWLKIQEDDSEVKKIEKILKSAFSKILPVLSREEPEEWIEDFSVNAQIWTLDKNWTNGINAYVNDDPKLFELFNDSLNFIWIPSDKQNVHLSKLYDLLKVKKLSHSVTYSISDVESTTPRDKNIFLNPFSLELTSYAIANLDHAHQGDFERVILDDTLLNLFLVKEFEVTELTVNVSIDWHRRQLENRTAFLDFDTNTLYVLSDTDTDDIIDDIAVDISRLIWGSSRYHDYLSSVTEILGVSKEKRLNKLKDKYGWTLNEEYQNLLDEVKAKTKKSAVNKPDSETSSDTAEVSENESNSNSDPDSDSSNDDSAGNRNDSDSKYNESDESTNNHKNHPDEDEDEDEDEDHNENTSQKTGNKSGEKNNNEGSSNNTNNKKSTNNGIGRKSGQKRNNNGPNNSRKGNYSGRNPRSKGLAKSVNQSIRNRMRSYVAGQKDNDDEQLDGDELAKQKAELGEQAEIAVVNDLQSKGYNAYRMPPNNKGYDIEATNTNTGELYFVEVKGDSYSWSDKGVGISKSQYQFATEKGQSFILAVVENLRSSPLIISYIQDPITHIQEYRFDSGWQPLSHDMEPLTEEKSDKTVEQQLIDMLSSDVCIDVIQYCHKNNYPYPEIGVDIVDLEGEIIFSNIELLWEEERLGVYLSDEQDPNEIKFSENWTFYPDTDTNVIIYTLDALFDKEI